MDWPNWNIVAAVLFGLVVLFFLSKIFFRPLKIVFRVLLQMVAGGAIIFLFNLAGGILGFTIGLNFISAIVVGVMGFPGLGMLAVLQYVLSS